MMDTQEKAVLFPARFMPFAPGRRWDGHPDTDGEIYTLIKGSPSNFEAGKVYLVNQEMLDRPWWVLVREDEK